MTSSSSGIAPASGTESDLLSLLYDEFRKLAAQKLARENSPQTLQATALVHEAWLRLGGDQQPNWANPAQFFAAAAEAMRRILIDSARKKQAERRGGGVDHLRIDSVEIASGMGSDQLLAVNEALERLARIDSAKADLVKLHFFAGLNFDACAEALGISTPTAKRYWTYARAWLYREIKREI